tara:strand:+ start:836 stop:1045 length:210 start_codon:yes stop_codon:yes gene_type:complete
MAQTKINSVNADLENKKCRVHVTLPSGVRIAAHQLDANPPGDQTESELRKRAVQALLKACQELIDNPPT